MVESVSPISHTTVRTIIVIARFFCLLSGFFASWLTLHTFYLRPWLGYSSRIDLWLDRHKCSFESWCIPQLPSQPGLAAALLAVLFFALAFAGWSATVAPPVAGQLRSAHIVYSRQTWLSVSLFCLLGGALIGYEAYVRIVFAEPVYPVVWLLGMGAFVAAALLWDAEDPANLARTAAHLGVALTIAVALLALAGLMAGRREAVLLLSLTFAGLAASSWWSLRAKSRLQPVDHAAMLILGGVALGLGTWRVWSWRYAFIGDEWGFYEFAHLLLNVPEQYATFTTHDANGYHTVFSSLLQAWTMQWTRPDLFGWRLSSVLPVALSVPALYVVGFWLGGRTTAWLSAGLLAASHMLLSFAQVPYNNTQALLPLTLGLGCFVFAERSRSALRFLLVGMAVGLGFLVYGLGRLAALPVGLLLVWHLLPLNRAAWGRTWMAASFVLMGAVAMAAPMLFDLGNWQNLLAATPVQSEVAERVDATTQMGRNALVGLHSFLTNNTNTHYVVGPHLDPITALLVLLGWGVILGNLRRQARAASFLVAGLLTIIAISAIQQYEWIATTRTFVTPAIYALYAGVGGASLLHWLGNSARDVAVAAMGVLVLVIAVNQLHITRVAQPHSHLHPEALIVQQVQETAAADGGGMALFLIDEPSDWRMNMILRAYHVARERVIFIHSSVAAEMALLCRAAEQPAAALIRTATASRATVEELLRNCWPNLLRIDVYNEAGQGQIVRYTNKAGQEEVAKPARTRASHRLHPDTLYVPTPHDLAVDAADKLYVMSLRDRRIVVFAPDGGQRRRFALRQEDPSALAVTPDGLILVAAQDAERRLIWYDEVGTVVRTISQEVLPITPGGIAVASTGDIYVTDLASGRIARLAPDGDVLGYLTGNGTLSQPASVAVALDGSLWVSNFMRGELIQLGRDDQVLQRIPLAQTVPSNQGRLLVGGGGTILLTNRDAQRVVWLDQHGQVQRIWYGFERPVGLAADQQGRIYIGDQQLGQVGILPFIAPENALNQPIESKGAEIAPGAFFSPLSPLPVDQ